MASVLYVNHHSKQCGVYEFGKDIANVLVTSGNNLYNYCECNSFEELEIQYNRFHPNVIIYNYHPTTMPWIRTTIHDMPVTYKLKAIHIGTIHEVFQEEADNAGSELFDFHIAPDPTLVSHNPTVFKTGRLLPQKPVRINRREPLPIIGSFGFATAGKGFDKIVTMVQEQFDEAVIRLNISYATFGDAAGENARKIADECRSLLYKKSIELIIDHTYLGKQQLLHFLEGNSINVFLYDDMPNRGISSATDWALASGRPLAVSKSRLFRNLLDCKPSICVNDNSIKAILENGTAPVEHLWQAWSSESIISQYDDIVRKAIASPSLSASGKRNKVFFYAKKYLQKLHF